MEDYSASHSCPSFQFASKADKDAPSTTIRFPSLAPVTIAIINSSERKANRKRSINCRTHTHQHHWYNAWKLLAFMKHHGHARALQVQNQQHEPLSHHSTICYWIWHLYNSNFLKMDCSTASMSVSLGSFVMARYGGGSRSNGDSRRSRSDSDEDQALDMSSLR